MGQELALDEGEHVLWWEKRKPRLRTLLRFAVLPLYVLMWGAFELNKYANTGLLPEPGFVSGLFVALGFLHVATWIGTISTELTITDRRIVLATPTWTIATSVDRIERVETCGADLAFFLSEPLDLELSGSRVRRAFSVRPPCAKGAKVFPVREVQNLAGLIADLKREGVLGVEIEVEEVPGAGRPIRRVITGVVIFLIGAPLMLGSSPLLGIGLVLVGAHFLAKSDLLPWSKRLKPKTKK